MFISIHMTTFCQASSGWLERALNSTLFQDYGNYEFIIYDDASYDGTQAVLEKFAKIDRRIHLIRGDVNLNSVSKSLGRCFLERSPETDAIMWMFDDNVLEEKALSKLCKLMIESNADVVYGQTLIKTPSGEDWLIGTRSPSAIGKDFLYNSVDVPNAGILIKPEVFDQSGWYDQNIIMRRSCDWDLFRRIWQTTDRIRKLDHVCATEFGELSASSLRNSFDTSFDLMARYVALRDKIGFRLDPLACTYGPADIIPLGDWSADELEYIYRIFVRYFVSVGDLVKGAEWARQILHQRGQGDLVIRNLRAKFKDEPAILDAVLSGMFVERSSASQTAPETIVYVQLGLKHLIEGYLQTKISSARNEVEKFFWRSTYSVAQSTRRLFARVF